MYWYCTALDEDMTVVIKKISFSCVVYLGPATRERFLLRCANILLLCIGVMRTYVIHGIQKWIVKSPQYVSIECRIVLGTCHSLFAKLSCKQLR